MKIVTDKYEIAGLNIEMSLLAGGMTEAQSEQYLNDFDGEPDLKLLYNPERIASYRERYPHLSETSCEYVYTGGWFYSRLLSYDGFMLHSSAVCYKGKAYLFSADSGTGKSTHTSLWKKYLGEEAVILNDDKPAVRIIDGNCYAFGTPWSGKTDMSLNAMVSVGGIVFLERGDTPEIHTEKNTLFIIKNILKQTTMPWTKEANTSLFNIIEKLLVGIPIYRFCANISKEAFVTSFEELTKEKYEG